MRQTIEASGTTGILKQILNNVEKLSEELKKIGLTTYEAKCYLGAVAIDGGRAEEIAELSMVPRTSAYKALDSLVVRGFVEQTDDRPRRFSAVDPVILQGRLSGDIESTFGEIANLKDKLEHGGIPQVVYMINGKDRVIRKIGELLERARDRFVISSPNISAVRKIHGKLFERALERGVEISIIAPPFVKLPMCTTAVRRKSLIATDVVMDSEEALIAAADLSACGFTDNALIAIHMEGFLEIVISQEWKEEGF